MSNRYFDTLRDSSNSGNYIPSGRQLPRTPPLTDVKRHLDFCTEDPNNDCLELQQNMEMGSRDQDDQNRTFDFNTHDTKQDDPKSLLKGMKGYQLTPEDLEFIEKMKEEKLTKKLQGDLEEVQRLLKKETMTLELTLASRDKAQAELDKFPSCEELTEWVKVVLKMTSPLTELSDLDAKSLLTMVTKENVQKAVEEKRNELTQMKKMVANKKKKEAKERGQLEKQIAGEQLKIQGLMRQLSDLKSELAQEEAYKPLQKEKKTGEKQSTSQQATSSRSRKKAAAAADAGEEAQNVGLRRSKRIASRR